MRGVRALRFAPRGESGVVGGVEAVAFGVLIGLVGALVIAWAWAVVDAKAAVSAAARDATRAFVEAPDLQTAVARADAAARAAWAARGRDPTALRVEIPPVAFRRCTRIVISAEATVPAVAAPGGVRMGQVTVRARHSEVIDPFRSSPGLEDGRC